MQQGNVILESSVKWDTSIRDCHIFIKELLAAVISMERTFISHPHCRTICLHATTLRYAMFCGDSIVAMRWPFR